MNCDLHVHTIHSGMCTVPGFRGICRESYNDPAAVYEKLKRQGMHLVTVTDHDSIDAAEALRRYPDFFVSEELTCTLPSGTTLHVGVYDVTDRQHIELQRRRDDFFSLLEYLTEEDLFFAVNHPLAGITGPRRASDFDLFAAHFPAIEARNGQIIAACNETAEQLAGWLGKITIAGSDAHSLSGLGKTFTAVPGARTKQEYLAGLRRGYGTVRGDHGSVWKLTHGILQIIRELLFEKPWTAALGPLVAALPVATIAVCLRDRALARYWWPRLRDRYCAPAPLSPHSVRSPRAVTRTPELQGARRSPPLPLFDQYVPETEWAQRGKCRPSAGRGRALVSHAG